MDLCRVPDTHTACPGAGGRGGGGGGVSAGGVTLVRFIQKGSRTETGIFTSISSYQ